jgi:hypothetical protein
MPSSPGHARGSRVSSRTELPQRTPFNRFATGTLLLLQTYLALSVGVIYDGGVPDRINRSRLSSFVPAEQFTLASAATLQGLNVFGSADVNNVPSRFSGTIGFRFLSNDSGAPGTSLALGSDNSVPLVDNGTQNVGAMSIGSL